MTNDNTYNGWTNYATWRVNLEIFDGLTLDDLGLDSDNDNPHGDYELGQFMRDYAESVITNDEIASSNLAVDYAMAFLSDVNWSEIAGHYITEPV
jgi:hypothetical protein